MRQALANAAKTAAPGPASDTGSVIGGMVGAVLTKQRWSQTYPNGLIKFNGAAEAGMAGALYKKTRIAGFYVESRFLHNRQQRSFQ